MPTRRWRPSTPPPATRRRTSTPSRWTPPSWESISDERRRTKIGHRDTETQRTERQRLQSRIHPEIRSDSSFSWDPLSLQQPLFIQGFLSLFSVSLCLGGFSSGDRLVAMKSTFEIDGKTVGIGQPCYV